MIVGIPRETYPGSRQVALVPDAVPILTKANLEVLVESGAGEAAGYLDDDYRDKGAKLAAGRDELFSQADIITIHTPKASDGKPIVGEPELYQMKTTAFLVNVARGGVVDEKSLCKCLRDRRISGAAIDVFEEEPYFGPLTELENTILTPHLGSYAREGRLKMEIAAVNNLLVALEQASLLTVS